jgi:hypothetical protein
VVFPSDPQATGQVAVGEQIEPQHRGQIGQRPVGFGEVMQPFQQQQGDVPEQILSDSNCQSSII